ncbi:polysaccharide deacetylase [Paenibacillus thalictri]|uniref:polysaccharide deacetylase n=1 Tax=Paenibacillus thalictri TaxID=2527873 RepID=UPI0013EEEA36|nr:polysaccharide deacetylase [Paenibacillus thalictri]
MAKKNFLMMVMMFQALLAIFPFLAYAGIPEDLDTAAVFKQLKSGSHVGGDKEYNSPEEPTVYLTFDDGPSKLTGRVLDILQDEGVKATFFVLGNEARQRPDTVRRIVQEGHALGNHSYNHVYSELYGAGFSPFWKQIQKTEDILNDIAGVRPALVRAPGGTYGNFDPFYFYYMEQAGYSVFDWNIDSGDASRAGVKASEITATVKKGPFRHEVILLMHDGSGHDESVKALPEVIHLFKDKGYTFSVLSPLVKPPVLTAVKPKWARSYTEAGFEDQLSLSLDHAALLEPQEAKSGPQDAAPQPPSEPQPPAVPLLLQLGERRLELKGEEYIARQDRVDVPLRRLIEEIGGRVKWDDARMTATVVYGSSRIDFDLPRHEIRLKRPEYKISTFSLAPMELSNGSLMVPLRTTLELLGSRIASYSMGDELREVTAELHPYIAFGNRL